MRPHVTKATAVARSSGMLRSASGPAGPGKAVHSAVDT